MADTRELRRKHAGVDLQQVVTRVDVYKRPLNSASGKASAVMGMAVHEAAVATTENGQLYLIEKGVDRNDDVNYKVRYREAERRIVQVTKKDIRDWQLVRSVTQVKPDLTLEDLFDACGDNYNFLADNCWNSTKRMRVAANESEDGLEWQEKLGIGVGVAAAIGIGALVVGGLMSNKNKEKEGQKY